MAIVLAASWAKEEFEVRTEDGLLLKRNRRDVVVFVSFRPSIQRKEAKLFIYVLSPLFSSDRRRSLVRHV